VALDDPFCQRQTETGAARVASAGLIEPGEPVEDSLTIAGRDAGPVVVDDEANRVAVGRQRYLHGLVGEACGIVEKVAGDSRQLIGAARDEHGRRSFTTPFDGQAAFGAILLDVEGCVAITVTIEATHGGGTATTGCRP